MFIAALNLQGRPEFPELLPHYTRSLHIEGRSTELCTQGRTPTSTVLIPSRDKRIDVYGDSSLEFEHGLEVLDSTAPGQTQAQKFKLVQDRLPTPHLSVLEIRGQHPGCAVLGQHQSLWSYVVFIQNSVYYTVGTFDYAASIRTYEPQSWLFRLPIVDQGCLFWSTEALCSKWWRWSKTFESDRLKCCNALELHLYDRRMVV